MTRYHPILVALHWLLAILIILGLIMGNNVLSATPNDVPAKLFYLKMHMFYVVVILMAASGLAIANMAGLPEIVFQGSGAPLPASFDQFPPRVAHGILAVVLMLLIAGHFLAFLYHQFIRKDRLFSRMWFGRRD